MYFRHHMECGTASKWSILLHRSTKTTMQVLFFESVGRPKIKSSLMESQQPKRTDNYRATKTNGMMVWPTDTFRKYTHMCLSICRVWFFNNFSPQSFRSSIDREDRLTKYRVHHRGSVTLSSHHKEQRYEWYPRHPCISTTGLDIWNIDAASHGIVPTSLCLSR